jgi:hypothetical protein
MTDGQWLFLTFLVLYLVESLRWLPPKHALLIGSGQALGWRWRRPSARFQFRGQAAVFLPCLPPIQAWQITCPWPWVPEHAGLRIKAEDASAPDSVIPWSDLRPRTEEQILWLSERQSLLALNPAEATRWLEQVQAWQKLPPEQQAAAFKEEAHRLLDPEQAKEAATQADRQTRALRWLGSGILIWCYGGITWLYWRLGESPWLYGGVIGLFLLMLAQALLFVHACRSKVRQGRKAIPWWGFKTLGILLFPPMAIRAADHLFATQDTYYHPLADKHLVPENAWLAAALQTWRETLYRPGWKTPNPDPDARLEVQTLHQFLAEQKVDIDTLDTDNAPQTTAQDPQYCPRCRALFTAAATSCADCGGIELFQAPPIPK